MRQVRPIAETEGIVVGKVANQDEARGTTLPLMYSLFV